MGFILLLICAIGWMRFAQSIYQWQYLKLFNVSPPPAYSLASGLLVGLGMGIGLAAFWLRKRWSKRYLQVTLAAAGILWWLDFLLFTRNEAAFSNWPFRMVGTLVVFGFLFGYLQMLWPEQRKEKADEK